MRRSLLLGFLTIGATVGGCGGGGEPAPTAPAAAGEVLFPPLSAEAVAERMTRLVAPDPGPDRDETDNEPSGVDGFGGPLERAMGGWNVLIDLAQVAPASVEPELLRIARTHESFVARWRATEVLVERGHPEAPALAGRLCESPIPGERHAAWWLCRRMTLTGRPPPIPASSALERLEVESGDGLRADIVEYLGAAGDRAATLPLVALLEQGAPALARSLVYALGCLEDPRAVPAVLAAGPRVDTGTWLQALGNLGSPEAIDVVIARLDEYGAIDALVASRSPKAIPALEKRLADLAGHLPEERAKERDARVALVRLRYDDPIPELLSIVEDRSADLELRRAALYAARRERDRLLEKHAPRLAAFYARETDPELLEQCLTTLEESRAPGVTAAMLRHADVWSPYLMNLPEYLLRILNRRLGANYRTLDEVRARPAK
jgi:hypothetical protein